MQEECDLPYNQKNDRHAKKAPSVKPRDEEQRREHHGEIPVVDAAGHAAAVLEEPGLERAEEQDADHIAHRIQRAEQKHEVAVQNSDLIQSSKRSIEHDPDKSNENGCVIIFDLDFCVAGLLEILSELLLTARASDSGREEPRDHFACKEQPKYAQQDFMLLELICDGAASVDQISDPQKKKHSTKH